MTILKRVFASRVASVFGLLALAAAGPAIAKDSDSYGYLRVVEGEATLIESGSNDRESAEINQPVLAGDRLIVPNRSRLEIVLADRNVVRVDGGSELILERLAASPDANDRATVLRLLEGNLQLVVLQESLGDELPRVETPNATIYVQNYGVYRVTAEREGWSELAVRRGTAEVVTERGSAKVRADEGAVIEGDRLATVEVTSAGSYDSLERWARKLDEDFEADTRYVDDNLRYDAAPLARHGSWIYVDSRPYWRPRVDSGWRPYWHGRWRYTPSGLTWVSSEPWGWVPYHYGSWDYLPAYGWVWEPGYVYSPAWVYWYWGSSHVGWCPTGYYTRYYGSRFGHGFRTGVYGWAGGSWDHYDRWTFVNSGYFRGYRDGYRDGHRDGRWDVRRHAVPIDGRRGPLGRGVITTDTRPLKPNTWKDPEEAIRALRATRGGKDPGDLPDVTSFIARKPDLPDTVARHVAARDREVPDGTPLKPSTLGPRLRQPVESHARDGRVVSGQADPRVKPDTVTQPEASTKPRRIVIGDDASGSRSEGRPSVRESPGRPAQGEDGGATKPRRVIIDSESGGGSRDDASAERKPAVRPSPRETPSARRPAEGDDGGTPKPDRRPSVRSNDDERPAAVERERPPSRPSRDTEERPSYSRPSSREVERVRPPSRDTSREVERERPSVRDTRSTSRESERPRSSAPSASSSRERERDSSPSVRSTPRSSDSGRSSRGSDSGRSSRSGGDKPRVRESRPPRQ
jgi:hypothetical protein